MGRGVTPRAETSGRGAGCSAAPARSGLGQQQARGGGGRGGRGGVAESGGASMTGRSASGGGPRRANPQRSTKTSPKRPKVIDSGRSAVWMTPREWAKATALLALEKI